MSVRIQSIEEDNVFFERMVNLVPPDIYFDEGTRRRLKGQEIAEKEDELEVADDNDDAAPPVQANTTDEGVLYDMERLYVRDLQPYTTKETLSQMFPGAVKIHLKGNKHKDRNKLSSCLVSFDSPEAAKLALDAHQGRMYKVMYSRIRHAGANTGAVQSKSTKRAAEAPEQTIKAKKQKIDQSAEKKGKTKVAKKSPEKPFHLKSVTEIQEALYTKENERNHKKEMKTKLKESKAAQVMQVDNEMKKPTATVHTAIKEKGGTEAMTGLSVKEINSYVTLTDEKSIRPAEKPCSVPKPKVSVSQPVTPKQSIADPSSPKATAAVPIESGVASVSSGPVEPMAVGNLSDNQAKLHAKIAELQAKRKVNDPERQQKLIRRREKKQQQKLLKKQKKKEKKTAVKAENGSVEDGNAMKEVGGDKKSPVKQVLNKDGQTVFSKFDFSASSKKEKKKGVSLTGKDYKTLLGKIEKRNEKINNLKSKDESAAKQLEDKFKWEAAMNKAEGIKVKDNPEVLKRALKRKENIKKMKKKQWDSRVEHTKKIKDAKQAKRNKNIEDRKQANKDKKIKKLKKKGRIIPGF